MVHVKRWNFFNTIPYSQESTNDYVNRLANIAKDCHFENFSIKGAIMQNLMAHSLLPNLRQAILDEQLDMDQTLIWARKFEEIAASDISTVKIEINDTSNEDCVDTQLKVQLYSSAKVEDECQNDEATEYYNEEEMVFNGEEVVTAEMNNTQEKDVETNKSKQHDKCEFKENGNNRAKSKSKYCLPRESDMLPNYEFIKTTKSKNTDMNPGILITHSSMIYWMDRCSKDTSTVYYICSKRKTNRCMAKAIVRKTSSMNEIDEESEDRFILVRCTPLEDHTHAGDYDAVFAKKNQVKMSVQLNELEKEEGNQQNLVTAFQQKFICENCGKVYSTSLGLKQHVESIHEGIFYSCDKCSYTGNTPSNLRQHILANHDGARHPCKQCDKVYSSSLGLKRHIESVHEGLFYICDQCNYKGTTRTNLLIHIKSIHERIQHPCDQCDKIYTSKQKLKLHIKTFHEGAGHFCDQCEYKATQKCILKSHIDSVHKKLSHPCDQCGKFYGSKRRLREHVETVHEGAGFCEHCDYKATRREYLNKHMLKYHSEQMKII